MSTKRYHAELKPDPRGFTTFLKVNVEDGVIVNAWLDGVNVEENPYGTYKSTSSKYNHDMHAESGTYYRDAAKQLEREIIHGVRPLTRVKGARVLTADARELLADIEDRIKKDLGVIK